MKLVPVLLVAVLLAACSPAQPRPAPTVQPTVPTPTAAPTAVPTEASTQASAATSAPTAEAVPATAAIPNSTPRLRALDFAPFEEALAGFTPERAAVIEAIVKDATIPQVQAAMQAGSLTSEELTLYFVSRIRQYDETLRHYLELNQAALDEARAADARRKDGTPLGPLDGIPLSLKDNIETGAPMHTTAGAQILLNNAPTTDAPLVKNLRAAGAVILGKANLSEFAGAIALVPGASAVGGLTVNPHNRDFTAGGSSSGSAAGVAAYAAMAGVGSETSGSLIAPSSWNGVVGMYPSEGVVDGNGVIPLLKINDSAGPIGRSVTDVALLLGAIDTRDVDYAADLDAAALNGARVGFLKADVLAHPSNPLEDTSDNADIVQRIEAGLTSAGATVTDTQLTGIVEKGRLDAILGYLLNGGIRHDMMPYLVAAGAPVTDVESLLAYNAADPAVRIPYGQRVLEAAAKDITLLNKSDFDEGGKQEPPNAAASLDAAFAQGADVLVSVNNYHSIPYATANYPAVSVPLGLRANGMPVGVTFIGKPGEEAKLLAYAYAFEQATKARVNPDVAKFAQASTPTATPVQTTSSQASAASTTERIRCPAPLGGGEVEGTTYHCGVVYVPENYSKPDGRVIELAYLVLHSTSLTPESDPVVYLSGGPGGSALSEMSNDGTNLRVSFTKIRERRDVVTFDQRGTRYSSMLFCSAFAQLVKNVPAEIAQNPAYQKFISEFGALSGGAQGNFTRGMCGRALELLGTDITQYNSTSSVRDIAEVVKAAGYTGQYNLYGISYGTRLALTVMRDAPKDIRSVVLDSTYPPEIQNYETSSTLYEEPYQQVFRLCRESPECNTSYPNIEKRFIDLLTRIGKQPIVVDPPIDVAGTLFSKYVVQTNTVTQIDPSVFVQIAQVSNGAPRGGWMPYIPTIVHYLEAGDVQTVVDLINGKLRQPVAPPILTPELQRLQELQQSEAQTQTNINTLLQQQTQASASARPAAQWFKIVTDYLSKQSFADGSLSLPTLALFWLPVYSQTAQSLTTFANDALDADTAKAANAIVAQMTPDDVRETFNDVRSFTIKAVGVEPATAIGQQFGVECYEEVPFQNAEREQTIKAALPYPNLFNPESSVNNLRQLCAVFERTGVRAPAIENQRVVSNIPVLIYQGLIDTQTPYTWGPSAAKGLRNSTLVYVADSGHAVMPKTPCAQSVSAHFFDRPGTTLNTACINTTLSFPTVETIESLKAQAAARAAAAPAATAAVTTTVTVTSTSALTATVSVTPTLAVTATATP